MTMMMMTTEKNFFIFHSQENQGKSYLLLLLCWRPNFTLAFSNVIRLSQNFVYFPEFRLNLFYIFFKQQKTQTCNLNCRAKQFAFANKKKKYNFDFLLHLNIYEKSNIKCKSRVSFTNHNNITFKI